MALEVAGNRLLARASGCPSLPRAELEENGVIWRSLPSKKTISRRAPSTLPSVCAFLPPSHQHHHHQDLMAKAATNSSTKQREQVSVNRGKVSLMCDRRSAYNLTEAVSRFIFL
ncbi:putative ATP-dependent RNA helicase DHX57-like protein [Anopheles sinensis]|uniref:Putative ATP-dependent RNA helicase DHX57-like protein n=1 Tax=Anopheles sinensis TaxID=74873 RepID=A0A084W1S5_ANOSI|nr:putative ATP-dependent RNA helicase DHX57-like protein [Anopheles sinensis]